MILGCTENTSTTVGYGVQCAAHFSQAGRISIGTKTRKELHIIIICVNVTTNWYRSHRRTTISFVCKNEIFSNKIMHIAYAYGIISGHFKHFSS